MMNTITLYFWFLSEGESEDYENLYADRASEIERYIEKTGGKIKTKWTRRLKVGQEESFKFIVPIRYKIEVLRGGILRFYWTAKGIKLPRGHRNVERNWIFREFFRTGGIQTFEIISPHLLGGVMW